MWQLRGSPGAEGENPAYGVSMIDEILTVVEAAQRLKIKPSTMRLYARTRIVRAVKIGKHWRILASDLPCSTSDQRSQGHTGGYGSRSAGLRYGNRVAQIARNVRKRLNRT
jgi:excisionase family DNA binding protein